MRRLSIVFEQTNSKKKRFHFDDEDFPLSFPVSEGLTRLRGSQEVGNEGGRGGKRVYRFFLKFFFESHRRLLAVKRLSTSFVDRLPRVWWAHFHFLEGGQHPRASLPLPCCHIVLPQTPVKQRGHTIHSALLSPPPKRLVLSRREKRINVGRGTILLRFATL